MSEKPRLPPAHLRADTREWWTSVLDEFELEEHHIKLLTLACEAWDRCQQARQVLREHGLTYDDRFSQPRNRPEVTVERDSRLASAQRLMRSFRQAGFWCGIHSSRPTSQAGLVNGPGRGGNSKLLSRAAACRLRLNSRVGSPCL